MELKIYADDFRKLMDWFAVCERLKIDKTSTEITLNVENAVGRQEEEETELCEGCNKEVPLSDLSDASAVTNEYVEKVKVATGSMTGFSETYNKSVDELTESNNTVKSAGNQLADSYSRLTESLNKENEQAVDGNKSYGVQLENMNKNLEALNAVYEMQISNSNEQLDASKKIYGGINDMMESLGSSVDDAKKYKEEIAQLGTNLQALNTVYGNMLAAMNINNNN